LLQLFGVQLLQQAAVVDDPDALRQPRDLGEDSGGQVTSVTAPIQGS
jgi:hypothetical protein